MRNACDVTNVVEAANADGRQDRLENMLLQLEQCQKALQVCRHIAAPTPCSYALLLSECRKRCLVLLPGVAQACCAAWSLCWHASSGCVVAFNAVPTLCSRPRSPTCIGTDRSVS